MGIDQPSRGVGRRRDSVARPKSRRSRDALSSGARREEGLDRRSRDGLATLRLRPSGPISPARRMCGTKRASRTHGQPVTSCDRGLPDEWARPPAKVPTTHALHRSAGLQHPRSRPRYRWGPGPLEVAVLERPAPATMTGSASTMRAARQHSARLKADARPLDPDRGQEGSQTTPLA